MTDFKILLRNFYFEEVLSVGGKTSIKCLGLEARHIWNELQDISGAKLKRIKGRIFANGNDKILYFDNPDQLFGWIAARNIHAEWGQSRDMIKKGEFLRYIANVAEEYIFASSLPHFPAIDGFYYISKTEPNNNGRLDELVSFFKPATDKDKFLIKSSIVTPFWGGPFGNRPAFLIDGLEQDEQGNRGVGKTALTDAIALLCGSQVDLSHKTDGTEIRKMLMTADDIRLVRFDNIKEGTLSSETLESLITAPEISGHRMYVGHMTIPNWFTYFLTFNDANLSKDMSQRAMIIRLARPIYDPYWWPKVIDFIRNYKKEIIADIGYLLAQSCAEFITSTRFPIWEREVLGRCAGSGIQVTQASISIDRESVDETVSMREEFGDWCFEKIASITRKDPTGKTFAVRQSWVVGWLQNFDNNRKLSKKSAKKLLMKILPRGFHKESKLSHGIEFLIWSGARHDGKKDFEPTGAQKIDSGENGIQLSTWDFKSTLADDFSDIQF